MGSKIKEGTWHCSSRDHTCRGFEAGPMGIGVECEKGSILDGETGNVEITESL